MYLLKVQVLDEEWIQLIKEAKELGISKDEILEFLKLNVNIQE